MAMPWNGLSDQDLELIDGWCDQFEARWKQGQRPVIENILRSTPANLQSILCRELAFLEFDLRSCRGESPSFAEYAQRFPQIAEQVLERQRDWNSHSKWSADANPAQVAPPVHLHTPFPGESSQHARIDLPMVTPKYRKQERRGGHVLVAFGMVAALIAFCIWRLVRLNVGG